MNSDLATFMSNIDNLRNLVRYQNAPRVSQETVAEHSFFVSAYVLKLHDYYEFDLGKALQMAILHDYAEAFISDVPHPIKKRFPMIADELERAEFETNAKDISLEFAKQLEEFNNNTSVEGNVLAFADILSVISYSKYEINLGNSKYMYNVLTSAKDRLTKVIEKCSDYRRENITDIQIFDEITKFIS